MGSGVPLEPRINLPETGQFFEGKIAGAGQDTIKNRRNMAVGKKKQVFSFSIHIKGGIMLHGMEIQGNQKISTTQRSSGVATLTSMDHANNIPSDLGGDLFQFLYFHRAAMILGQN